MSSASYHHQDMSNFSTNSGHSRQIPWSSLNLAHLLASPTFARPDNNLLRLMRRSLHPVPTTCHVTCQQTIGATLPNASHAPSFIVRPSRQYYPTKTKNSPMSQHHAQQGSPLQAVSFATPRYAQATSTWNSAPLKASKLLL